LPVESAARSERDAVLGLHPEGYERLREALDRSWAITDPELLELCRLRMAKLFECRAELAAADEATLAELEDWHASPAFSERERSALGYAEQFVIDQNGITAEQKAGMLRQLSERGLCNFTQALNIHDGYLRVLSVLDVAPDPEPRSETRRAKADPLEEIDDLPPAGLDRFEALTDAAFRKARAALGATMALSNGVDEVTTEICRLRNANHQACRY
jgi:alkylhydroperoxidase family enzyme